MVRNIESGPEETGAEENVENLQEQAIEENRRRELAEKVFELWNVKEGGEQKGQSICGILDRNNKYRSEVAGTGLYNRSFVRFT